MNILKLLNRERQLFVGDWGNRKEHLNEIFTGSRVLVVGGAGSIGSAVTSLLFEFGTATLDVVDLSENNLVELVRGIRSKYSKTSTSFDTYAIDVGSKEFEHLFEKKGGYDYIFNLSALKHVRNEKDEFTLRRMLQVNVVNAVELARISARYEAQKYFCVSTDKAANPANLMGASKRIMEKYLMLSDNRQNTSFARFANVAFSDGSLLDGFLNRIRKRQPLSAPSNIRRFFITDFEAASLCLFSAGLGQHLDIFFPKVSDEFCLQGFGEIAKSFLTEQGYYPLLVESEDDARMKIMHADVTREWPLYLFKSDTDGEKEYEEFFTDNELVDDTKFQEISLIKNEMSTGSIMDYEELKEIITSSAYISRKDLKLLINNLVPELSHNVTGKSLNERM